jgi:hypothetical protein
VRETIAAVVASLAFSVLSGADAVPPPAKPCRDEPRLMPGHQQSQAPVFQDLAKSGKKCWIGEDHYFTWEFDKTPKMGTSILIIKLHDKDGTRVSDLALTGRSDMPAMPGAHDSGDIPFKNNKAGDYLLPVNLVMPGDWEVLLNFSLDGSVIFRGRIAFHV